MSNEFKRVPTCGENDVDLRVATEPRRVTDAVLSQIIAVKDGEIAALTAEVTHLAEKLAERDAKVFGGVAPQVKLWDSQWVNIVNHADCYRDMSKEDAVHLAVKLTEERMKTNYAEAGVAPQPVDAAQATEDILRDMLAIQEACGLHTDEYAPGSVIEYIKELEADAAQPVAQAVPKQCGACGANVGERCRTMSDDQCDAGKYVAPVAQPTDTTKAA